MARQHSPLQKLKEARTVAQEHNLRIAECPKRKGIGTDYVVYRKAEDGSDTRLGKRSSIDGLRTWVFALAKVH